MEVCNHLWNYFSLPFWFTVFSSDCLWVQQVILKIEADDWQTLLDSGQSLLVTSGSLTSQVWYLLLLCLRSHLLFHSLSFFQPLSISLMYFPWEGSDSLCKLFCKQSVFIWAVSRSCLSLLALHWWTDTFCIQATLCVHSKQTHYNHMLDSFLSLQAWVLTMAILGQKC